MPEFDARAPVIIGVGESSRKNVAGDWPSPRDLAGAAIKAALDNTGKSAAVAAAIDTIAAIRTFEDSGVSMGTGSPDNVPQAFGAAGGVSAQRLIYADIGGQSPQAMVNELSGAIRRGEIDLALIVGAEANGTAKRARKAGVALDWTVPSDTPFDDRLSAFPILGRTEIRHGIISMPLAYSLMENARRQGLGQSREEYAADMAQLWSAFAQKSLCRQHAQFAAPWSKAALLSDADGNYPLTDIYRRWFVAQDAVDLGGAIILTSAGKAREMGVVSERMIWLAGAAETKEPPFCERADLVRPYAFEHAIHGALDQMELTATDLGPVDIYSCFPVAVFAAIDSFRDPGRAPGDYTLTGGLSFFGGPGNGYALYSIAAMVETLRHDRSRPGMITANGGVMSKQAIGIYSGMQPERGWNGEISADYHARSVELNDGPTGRGQVLGYARPVVKDVIGNATLIVELEGGGRAMAVVEDAPEVDLARAIVQLSAGEKRHIAHLI